MNSREIDFENLEFPDPSEMSPEERLKYIETDSLLEACDRIKTVEITKENVKIILTEPIAIPQDTVNFNCQRMGIKSTVAFIQAKIYLAFGKEVCGTINSLSEYCTDQGFYFLIPLAGVQEIILYNQYDPCEEIVRITPDSTPRIESRIPTDKVLN